MKRLDKLKPKEIFGRLRNSFNKKARRRRNDHELEIFKDWFCTFCQMISVNEPLDDHAQKIW